MILLLCIYLSRDARKSVCGISKQARHKPVCAAAVNTDIVKSLKFQTDQTIYWAKTKGADLLAVTVQLICVFAKMLHAKRRFSHHAAHFVNKKKKKKKKDFKNLKV